MDRNNWLVNLPNRLLLGYLGGGVDANALNTIYNLADLVNKFLFGLVIWYAAMMDSGVKKAKLFLYINFKPALAGFFLICFSITGLVNKISMHKSCC